MTFFRAKINEASTKKLMEKIEDLRRPMNKADSEAMGRSVVRGMKKAISEGRSPISGPGISARFKAYKNPARYPGKRKPKSPVNLYLSGKFLNDLNHAVFRRGKSYVVSIGFTRQSERNKERGHREGANGQPKRPIIPQASRRESFIRSIQSDYLEIALKAVRRITRRRK